VKTHSLKNKIIQSHCLIIATLLIVLELVVYLIVSRIQISDAARLNQTLVQTMCVGIDNSVKAFRGQINFVTMSDDMQEGLRSTAHDEISTMLRKSRLLSAIVRNTLVINEVDAVYLYEADKEPVTWWQKRPATSDTRELFAVMPPLEYPENGAVSMAWYQGQLVFTRRILDLDQANNREIRGYCVFLYEMNKLEKLLDNISPDSKRLVALLTPEGDVVAHSRNENKTLLGVLEELEPEQCREENPVWIRYGREKVLASSHKTEVDGWTVVCLVTKGQLLTSVQVTAAAIFLIGITALAVGILVETCVARRIVLPLSQLTKQVKRIEEADYSTHNDIGTGDELELLGQSINHMGDKINILINQVLKGEIAYKDMQLQALQAQINPHFLYNTLECINSLAQLGRKEDVRTVTVAFSNITKSLLAEKKEVTVESELSYVKDFLVIYEIMLGDKLRYSIDVSPELESCMIPRMIIQPFVENAVLHGIKPCGRRGTVSVSLVPTEEGILVSVNDDGQGIGEERMEWIEKYIADQEIAVPDGTLGVGMKNVIRRIFLCYGDRAKIHISSFPEMGTTIDLVLPVENF